MSNISPVMMKKSPWIPPPGRTCRKDKISTKTQTEGAITVVPCDTTAEVKNVADNDNLDIASISSVSSTEQISDETSIHLRSVKIEMKLLAIHSSPLKQMSQFINIYMSTNEIVDFKMRDSLVKIDDSVKDIIFQLGDLEYSVTFVENTRLQNSKAEGYLKMVKLKENLLSKILQCYSDVATIFQTIIQKQSAENTKMQGDQAFIKKDLQESEKKCASQSALIKDYERRLSILKGKMNTTESYKSTLEDTKTELHKQLAYKEAQIKYLTSEISQLNSKQSNGDHEKLLEIIEEIQKKAKAEKTALKKALKVQKLCVKKSEESLQKLEKDLKEKVKMMFNIATQRDQLKSHLTSAKNSILESKYQAEEMKGQNLKVQNELCEKESAFKKQLQELSDSLNEKTIQLQGAVQQKLKLEKDIEDMNVKFEMTRKELKYLKSSYSKTGEFLSQSHGDGKHVNTLEEVKNLISLLQDTKEYFKNFKMGSINPSTIGGENLSNTKDTSYNTLLTAVEEIKQYLLEFKDVYDVSSNKQKGKNELEGKLKEIQQLYSECSKENESLKTEIEEMKSSRLQNFQIPSNENYPSSYGPENNFSMGNIQMELRLKTNENWRLKEREKDLECQLGEVKEKLQRKEIEISRLFSVEDELRSRKNDLAVLERKKEEESERLSGRNKELQEALDKTTAENESLKRYVQILKTSYLNVFGVS